MTDSVTDSEHSEETPVVVQSYGDSVDATLARLWLSRNGVQATLTGDELAHTLNYVVAAQRIDLLVPQRDAQRAAALLEEFREASASASHGPWRCPKCEELCGAAFDECWQCGESFSEQAVL